MIVFSSMHFMSRFVRPCIAICFLALSVPAGSAAIDKNITQDRRQLVTIKIRNGKSGLPIWLASLYVFVGNASPSQLEEARRPTKFWSDAHVDIATADSRQLRVWVDFIHRDCRFVDGENKFRTFDYSGNTLNGIPTYDTDLILTKGIVAPNLCSDKTQAPEPGVLTIYVIPATSKELWHS